jgi:hypothetical protein
MQLTSEDQSRPRPGDRLTQHLWLRALASGGRLPMPTVDRVRAIKALVARWEVDSDE